MISDYTSFQEPQTFVKDRGAMEALNAGMKKGDEMPAASAFVLIHWAFDTLAQLNEYRLSHWLTSITFERTQILSKYTSLAL